MPVITSEAMIGMPSIIQPIMGNARNAAEPPSIAAHTPLLLRSAASNASARVVKTMISPAIAAMASSIGRPMRKMISIHW